MSITADLSQTECQTQHRNVNVILKLTIVSP